MIYGMKSELGVGIRVEVKEVSKYKGLGRDIIGGFVLTVIFAIVTMLICNL